MQGKKATCYPPMFEKLSDKSESNNRVVLDGNLITSQGPGTAMEFALSIVEKFYGRNKALELARMMVFVWSSFGYAVRGSEEKWSYSSLLRLYFPNFFKFVFYGDGFCGACISSASSPWYNLQLLKNKAYINKRISGLINMLCVICHNCYVQVLYQAKGVYSYYLTWGIWTEMRCIEVTPANFVWFGMCTMYWDNLNANWYNKYLCWITTKHIPVKPAIT